jgi:hypothetical protein
VRVLAIEEIIAGVDFSEDVLAVGVRVSAAVAEAPGVRLHARASHIPPAIKYPNPRRIVPPYFIENHGSPRKEISTKPY